MGKPIDEIANAISKAIADAIVKEKKTLESIAEKASSKGGGSPYSDVGDLAKIILGILGDLAVVAELTDPILALVKALGNEAGGSGNSFGIGYMLGSLGFQMAQPYLRIAEHEVENLAQSQILDPAQAAEFVTKQIISKSFGASEAGGGGWDGQHFNWMVQAAYTRPTSAEVLEMWNRGYVDEAHVNESLQYQGVEPYYWDAYKALRRQILSPADLALATLRNDVDMATATAYVAQWGLTSDDFQLLIGNTGEPPGEMQLLEAYRRGFIDQDTLERGIRQSRIRNEWIPTIEALRYSPMSTADAARAVVQNYLSSNDGAAIAQQNGLEPDHWQYIVESWGRPLSHEQMMTLYFRGQVTLDQVQQAFRESDLKDKYIDPAIALATRYPSLWEITQLLKDGILSADYATTLLVQQGYPAELAKGIVSGNGGHKVATAKNLSVADFVTMYEDGLVDSTVTIQNLESIGYRPEDARWIIAIADAKLKSQVVKASVVQIRTEFDRRLTDEAGAINKLTAIGISPAQAQLLLSQWTVVRSTATRPLSEAQIIKMVKNAVITPDDALTRLQVLGYSQPDAILIVEAYI